MSAYVCLPKFSWTVSELFNFWYQLLYNHSVTNKNLVLVHINYVVLSSQSWDWVRKDAPYPDTIVGVFSHVRNVPLKQDLLEVLLINESATLFLTLPRLLYWTSLLDSGLSVRLRIWPRPAPFVHILVTQFGSTASGRPLKSPENFRHVLLLGLLDDTRHLFHYVVLYYHGFRMISCRFQRNSFRIRFQYT